MKNWVLFLLIIPMFIGCSSNQKPNKSDLITPFEKDYNYSSNYFESVDYYQKLESFFPKKIMVEEAGESDAGKPIYKVTLAENVNSPKQNKNGKEKLVVLINNGIHAGEPCGVDASMMLARDILMDDEKRKLVEEITLVIIPIYNVG